MSVRDRGSWYASPPHDHARNFVLFDKGWRMYADEHLHVNADFLNTPSIICNKLHFQSLNDDELKYLDQRFQEWGLK